jgi:thiamine transport system permease protein
MDADRPALSRRGALLLAAPPALFLALFFAWPVASIVARGLLPAGGFDPGAVLAIWTRESTLEVLAFTIALALLCTALTLLAGLPAAWVFARFTFPAKRLARALVTVPFVLPTVVVASAFLALLGPRSPVNGVLEALLGPDAPRLRLDASTTAIVLASVFYNIAVIIRLVGGLWAHLDPRAEEAARMLGASPWRAFRETTWPLLRPAVLSATSIVLLFTLTSFGIVLLLGAPGQATLEVEIYRQTAVLLDLEAAAALSVLQLVGVFVLLLAHARAQERLAVEQRLRPVAEVERRPVTRRERAAVAATLVGLLALLGLPLLVMIERSFAGSEGYSLAAYQGLLEQPRRAGLFVPPAEAIGNSLLFALATLLIAGTLGLCAALVVGYRRGWLPQAFDALVMLPLGTSAVTVGFGFLIALDEPPLDLRTSVLLIPLAHALVALPFVVRAVAPVIRSIDPRLREAAAVLGAAPRRSWREIDGPIVARAALVGAGFAFAVSLGEFGATLFIARPDRPTLPIAIYRLLGLPGAANFATAMALSAVLLLLTACAVLLIERLRGTGPSPF